MLHRRPSILVANSSDRCRNWEWRSAKTPRGLGCHGRYITLSHRWNELTSSSKTLSNFEDRKKGSDPSTLLLTFQDAIQVARGLDIRYLWIDSLCIIQDSEEDWSRESSNMMSIYESAFMNIAAAGSEEQEERLFMEREFRLTRPAGFPRLPRRYLANLPAL
jgi:hypothetical protein